MATTVRDEGQASPRPNILLIQADQFRWDCLRVAGNPDVATPNLDRLVADGVRYSNAFCTYPVCTPSRYSLLSGLYVRQHSGWTNSCTLAPGIDTFPKALQRAGYSTAAVGKMHFTPTYLDVGYQRMELAEQHGSGRWDDDYHRELAAVGLAPVVDLVDQVPEYRERAPASYWRAFGARPSDLPEEWHSTTWIADRAMRALDGWSDAGGNLLHVSFIKPHHPFDPPVPWDSCYDPNELTVLPGWTDDVPPDDLVYEPGYFPNESLSASALRHVMAHYYGTISHLDHHVGRLLERLHGRGLYRDTLIVFTADHGEYLGFHHQLLKAGRGLYDPLTRVPLTIKFPGAYRSGTIDDGLVSQVDLAPTLVTAGGGTLAASLPGFNLTQPSTRSHVFAEAGNGTSVMARSSHHKLLASSEPDSDALFDLDDDPYELRNRIDHPDEAGHARELREALTRWSLFETTPPTHVDEHAQQVAHANASGTCHRDALQRFAEDRIADTSADPPAPR